MKDHAPIGSNVRSVLRESAASQADGGHVIDASVIIAAWNAAEVLSDSIGSALAQSGIEIEIIVCDDASTDNTPDLLKAWSDPRVISLRLPENRGPAGARNSGLAIVRGEWIFVLDADDLMDPTRLARLIKLGRETNADIVADNLCITGAAGQPTRLLIPETLDGACEEIGFTDFVNANVMFGSRPSLGYLKPGFRARFLRTHGLRYPETLRIGEDFALVAEMMRLGARYVRSRTAEYEYRTHDGSISHRLKLADVSSMLAWDVEFLHRHGGGLDPSARAAFASHLGALERAQAFTEMVEMAKGRDIVGLLRTGAKNPAALALFRMPLAARLKRLLKSA